MPVASSAKWWLAPGWAMRAANIAGAEDGWATRGVYVNNFVFLPKGA